MNIASVSFQNTPENMIKDIKDRNVIVDFIEGSGNNGSTPNPQVMTYNMLKQQLTGLTNQQTILTGRQNLVNEIKTKMETDLNITI